MNLTLYDTGHKAKREFTPQTDNLVKLYTCGPTVYNELQIGNWLAYLRWDLLVRLLALDGYRIERVMNITDVGHLVSDADDGEDKMEKGARREGVSAWEISKRYTDSFLGGLDELNLVKPTHLAKATDFINEQIDFIRGLEQKGHTYVIDDGVYFDTATFPDYAKFARLDLQDQKAGARVAYNPQKHNPSDFALWKFSPKDKRRDMEWDSPWGKGFPGWHIECSTIARHFLGDTLDIHTGGIDHIPVHHTNEIAQSVSLTGRPLANYWLHADFLTIDGVKISKSLNNGWTLSDIAGKGFRLDDFRLFALQSHYRSETNFTWDNLQGAHNRLDNWLSLAELRWQIHDTVVDDEDKAVSRSSLDLRHAKTEILQALNDDLNSPRALSLIDRQIDRIKATPDNLQQDVLVDFIDFIEAFSGLKLADKTPDIDDEAKQLILERLRAREAKDFERADTIREQLKKAGLSLLDTGTGQLWTRY
ncbi:MAG TPA: cysteine--tRNA ligase [Candidatus Saccharimonadales bacterium]|nr:cysteine--tRNA ligase [Candidatus Saccharimonadales bacterium]